MLRSLFTPLQQRFNLSPRPDTTTFSLPETEELEESPEDFAQDVIKSLMRTSVENLKEADNAHAKTEALAEIQRIMLQDACTKAVFKDLDGFLAIISLLSTLNFAGNGPVVEPMDQIIREVSESTRLVFMILSEAMYDHEENIQYFNETVGYPSIEEAVRGLAADARVSHQTMGLLLSFALNNFGLEDLFVLSHEAGPDARDAKVSEKLAKVGVILRPGAIRVLWDVLPRLDAGDSGLRWTVFKTLEHLSRAAHRNQVILGSLGLFESVFEFWQKASALAEKSILQRLLKRLLDIGAPANEARIIFKRAIEADDTLNLEVLELIRAGMKARWPEHFSFEGRGALSLREENVKGLPATGFTYMTWIWAEKAPTRSHTLFNAKINSRELVALKIRPDGKLEFKSSSNPEVIVFTKLPISKMRWTHVTLVHYPHRVSNPSIRLFLDGVLQDSVHWTYPAAETLPHTLTYNVGDESVHANMSICMASSYLISTPLGNDLPRLIHHLGPRYCGSFQDPSLVKFLTYEASTSLNMFLSSLASKNFTPLELSPIMKAVRDGFGVGETSIIFSISPKSYDADVQEKLPGTFVGKARLQVEAIGDVFVAHTSCLDMALWRIGGAAVPLLLVKTANTPHELSRAIGILTDGLRNSWQNSEDMERLRGYEILADLLRHKSDLINMTTFETIFEFLGLNFRNPDHSTVVNTIAYRAIALDFELWSKTKLEIQRVHLEHFTALLQTSRYKRFNVRQRLGKMGLVRKLLFVLQTQWYPADLIPIIVYALQIAANAHFSKEDAIKPIVSYLAANLHQEAQQGSPRSIMSRMDISLASRTEKAEQVLEALILLLSTSGPYTKFAAALPLTRICLLLLGDRPSSVVASQVLLLVAISLNASSSFSRKFELVSGWSIFKVVLPRAWDPSVHEAVFDILLGRYGSGPRSAGPGSTNVACPYIAPTIFEALHIGLDAVAHPSTIMNEEGEGRARSVESSMEVLVEELIELHSSSLSFRQMFRSAQLSQLYVDTYKSFVAALSSSPDELSRKVVRLLEKLTHISLAVALDEAVPGAQKREIVTAIHLAEALLNPSAQTEAKIDPELIVDNRSIRRRMASSRLSVQVGDRTVNKSMGRMHEWRKTIIVSERKRLRKNVLDLRENRRQISQLNEWSTLLSSERGLWVQPGQTSTWRLDETEGPQRIRKKMEPAVDKTSNSRVDGAGSTRGVQEPDSDAHSVMQVELPPWAEAYEISAIEVDEDRELAEEIAEDKHRRVRHELEPGDIIQAVMTVARVAGVDSSPGLLIFGQTHLYMLDGLVESDDGEVIDAHEAPRRLFFVPGSIVELDGPQRAQRWTFDQVANYSDKTFIFRDVALEIYFKDSRSLLVVFLDSKRRQAMTQRLSTILHRGAPEQTITPAMKTPFGKLSAKVLSGFKVDGLATAQRKWQAREISNFTYISIINQVSGRTPSDATQYPIFPWVVQDYTSDTLDLNAPETYRDLTKPMGALTDPRREAATLRYTSLESVEEIPFHYGTHFSSSMIVCHFLIRLAPFTNMFKTLQGGDWDLPDRLFSDVGRAWHSASADVRGDVRELIPEFFNCPEFLENSCNIDFGIAQTTGRKVDDVVLPPWCKQDPLLFVLLNRQALESKYVSENLPAWIDLIWGCKQRDPESLNVFHPLSYEGTIDLDSISDELEKEASIGIIHNFGQTPRKLFHQPHPERYMHGLSTLPIGTLHGIPEDALLLKQSARPAKNLGNEVPVRELGLDVIGERIVACPAGMLSMPLYTHEQVLWGPTRTRGDELRISIDNKTVQVVEASFCTCAVFADPENLVTGSSDQTVRLWQVTRGVSGGAHTHVTLSHIMRGHTEEVTCVAASRTWSVVVSGSKDGSAAIWDLNRGTYVQSIWHGEGPDAAVHLVAINESTGYIATCSRNRLDLHTVNARPMASLDLTALSNPSPLPVITSLAFHEREFSYMGVIATGGPDGAITLRTWNTDGTPAGEKAQWEFITIRSMAVRTVEGTKTPCVTALKFIGESLCHGEDTGKAFMWMLPD